MGQNTSFGRPSSFAAVHTLANGRKVYRNLQYSQHLTLTGKLDAMNWRGWRDSHTQMMRTPAV
jgi:hypothetical protein